jgi:sulfur relay (sulfurtransferase) DsrC/TusE family protein
MQIQITVSFEHGGEKIQQTVTINSRQINSDAIDEIFTLIEEQSKLLPYVPEEYNTFDVFKKIRLLLKSVKRDIESKVIKG